MLLRSNLVWPFGGDVHWPFGKRYKYNWGHQWETIFSVFIIWPNWCFSHFLMRRTYHVPGLWVIFHTWRCCCHRFLHPEGPVLVPFAQHRVEIYGCLIIFDVKSLEQLSIFPSRLVLCCSLTWKRYCTTAFCSHHCWLHWGLYSWSIPKGQGRWFFWEYGHFVKLSFRLGPFSIHISLQFLSSFQIDRRYRWRLGLPMKFLFLAVSIILCRFNDSRSHCFLHIFCAPS